MIRRTRGTRFTGATALVTGAGSGIGAALARALSAEGALVACHDLDGDAARATAEACGSSASAHATDVTDPHAVQAAVDEVVSRHGRLDLLFNNAGITWGGRTEDLTLAQWDAIIDVNIRGVVHGVAAAYPLMQRQGSGHIVNTASMGGLMAAGLITSYCMTKHAVVGLSLALRTEAAASGVRVTAVCPAAVETPILDKGAVGAFDGRRFYLSSQGLSQALDVDVLADQVLEGMRRNRALVVTPSRARASWRAQRFLPGLTDRITTRYVRQQMEAMRS
ncbi:Levodione reductase [Nocardioides dokdonensis FR1436]|uniref:Levodione reductase n=1 Tax=Nocardioides dokdonensis FR1436 TaxID=1300347 RepID=A0A1A9GQA5_9ACTN|nr:SDR family oxidoreductase [Nocardioides dokdonensis]ANH39625.1 Levodione reductase [Nocardioides dokdonensis FR1436]